MFNPNIQQFSTMIRVLKRTSENVNGSPKLTYVDATPALDYCNWKSKGGTENTQSGSLQVYDTAEVTMWYRSDLNVRDRLLLNNDPNMAYEVINIENVEMKNKWLILKVSRDVNA